MTNSVIPSICLLLLGFAATIWGIWLLAKPDSLRPESPIYRWIYWRWFARKEGARYAKPQLNEQQIRLYGALMVVVGLIITVGVGLLLFGEAH